jgi:hypothetical protein
MLACSSTSSFEGMLTVVGNDLSRSWLMVRAPSMVLVMVWAWILPFYDQDQITKPAAQTTYL